MIKNLKAYSGVRHIFSNKGVKLTSSILALTMLFSLASCGKDNQDVTEEKTAQVQNNNSAYFDTGEHNVIIELSTGDRSIIYFHTDEVVDQEDVNEIAAPVNYEIEKIDYSGSFFGSERWLMVYYRNLVPVMVKGTYDEETKQISYNDFGTIVKEQETTMVYQKTIS